MMAGQNMPGFSLTRPNTAGSDPIGNSVAEMKATTKTVLRPNFGSASSARADSSQASMGGDYGQPDPVRGGRGGRTPPLYFCLAFQQPALPSRWAPLPAAPPRCFISPPSHSRRSPMRIGHIPLANPLFAAPMAGVTDRPFRQLCKRLGAGYAVSEMVTSRKDLWTSLKTSRRANHDGEVDPIAVQIAGTDAAMMAEAAAYNIDRGAQIIDINMGCPAKKVCSKWAGSTLMQDEPLALQIIEAVVAACVARNVPVTLKMRTGWCDAERNALRIALAAEGAGVAMVTVHGRT